MFPKRALLLLSVFAIAAPAALSAEPITHDMMRLWLDTPAAQQWFDENHLALDVSFGLKGQYVDLVVEPSERAGLKSAPGRLELLQENIEEYSASRLGGDDRDAGFGVYHTYSESVAWMDSLHMLYPQVVSARWSIGQSLEGNEIWCYRVSDNPDVDEEGEPEILFDGLHHAREIMASEIDLMLTAYLAAAYYAGDPEISELLDNREIYCVPIVNPDGFLYNELTNPSGGGMWRKNRRNNGNGTYGVDVNRNYPYEWGCDWGSSGNPGDETYRGTAPGSEPETQVMMAFINSREFVVRQSWHSYGELTLYAWGYTTNNTPDEAVFQELASAMVQFNGYSPGQPGDVLYDVCGGTFDWDYGAENEHGKIFGFTNELGVGTFWPGANLRQPIFEENIWPSVYLIGMAGELRGVTWEHSPLPFTAAPGGTYTVAGIPTGYGGAAIDAGSVTLRYRLNGGGFVDQLMTATGNPGEYGATIPGQPDGAVIEYYLSAADVDGNDGTSPRSAPSGLHYFEVGAEFVHGMEADRGWTVGALDDDAGTGIWVRVDPVGTAAQPEDDHTAAGTHCWVTGQHQAGESIGYNDVDGGKTTLFSPVYDMAGAQSVVFSYWRWFSNDQGSAPGEDYWDVFVSNDGGATWTELEHTLVSSNAWESQAFDLAAYFPAAAQVQLKFVAADEINGSIVEAAVDDFSIAGVFDATGTGDLPAAFDFALGQNYPNPFNPKTTIRFELAEAGPVSLGIYDANGRAVRILHQGEMPEGVHAASWNGLDAMGRPVASGVYFARLRTSGGELSRRMVLMK